MKERIRANALVPKYEVSMYYHSTGCAQWLATNPRFESITLFVIGVNAIYMAIDSDENGAPTLLEAALVFQVFENFFCLYFSFEWLVRFLAFKRKLNGFKDPWFVFDSFLVGMMVAETWIMTAVLLLSGSGGSLGNTGVLRLARLLRLSRMARMARLLRAMPELLILVKGMTAAMRSVFLTLTLLAIFNYVFAIMFKQITAETEVGEEFFPTVGYAMQTLLLHGTLLDDLRSITDALIAESIPMALLFYFFVLVAALTVLNILIGVLCEVVSVVSATEKETIAVAFVSYTLQELIRNNDFDQNGDNLISREEFERLLEMPEATKALGGCGVDVIGLIDNLDFIFQADADDADAPEKQLTFAEFMALILDLWGSNIAKVKDIIDLRKYLKMSADSVKEAIITFKRSLQAQHAPPGPRIRRSSSPQLSRMPQRPSDPVKQECHPLKMTRQALPDFDNLISITRKLGVAQRELQEFLHALDFAEVTAQESAGELASGQMTCAPEGSSCLTWIPEDVRSTRDCLAELKESMGLSLESLRGVIAVKESPAVHQTQQWKEMQTYSLATVSTSVELADATGSDTVDFFCSRARSSYVNRGNQDFAVCLRNCRSFHSFHSFHRSDEDDPPDDESYDEVPNPPQLPAVPEEKLQEAWTLGDASFQIFLCPITHDVMTDPVVSADGYTYERSAISRWFETSRKSPVTGQSLPHTDLVANHSVRTLLKMLIDMTCPSSSSREADAAATHGVDAACSSSSSWRPRSGRKEPQPEELRPSSSTSDRATVAAFLSGRRIEEALEPRWEQSGLQQPAPDAERPQSTQRLRRLQELQVSSGGASATPSSLNSSSPTAASQVPSGSASGSRASPGESTASEPCPPYPCPGLLAGGLPARTAALFASPTGAPGEAGEAPRGVGHKRPSAPPSLS
ncbi:unnamed protein product [Polarella glacialis]|uniref:U-box domain-containing protein n=1 Tax=Polarella glacialis TaxID=89957 RepID=A0A813FVF8_POLGL|nr:unnamed protein product [Polarella glacialis]